MKKKPSKEERQILLSMYLIQTLALVVGAGDDRGRAISKLTTLLHATRLVELPELFEEQAGSIEFNDLIEFFDKMFPKEKKLLRTQKGELFFRELNGSKKAVIRE